jgi:hypothetical protein
MRLELLSYLTTALSTATIKVSQELPWNTAGEPLHLKNMKKFYLDEEQLEQTTLLPTLNGDEVFQNDTTVTGYFAVDAKNQPAGLAAALSTILGAKNSTDIINFGTESDYTTEIVNDVLIYTVEYRLNQATT